MYSNRKWLCLNLPVESACPQPTSCAEQIPCEEPGATDALNQIIQGKAPQPVVELSGLPFRTIVIPFPFHIIPSPDKPTYVLVSFPILVVMIVLLVLAIVIILILACVIVKRSGEY